jgi:hypothetical protein
MKKLILVLVLFMAFAATSFAQNTGSPHVRQHVKLQAYYSYETRVKANKAFSVWSAKNALKDAKAKAKVQRKRDRVTAKRERIYVRIEELKNN